MSEHTKTPWKFIQAKHPNGTERSIDCAILDLDNEIIAETFEKVGRTSEGQFLMRPAYANAAYIVQCVNNFEQLIKALEYCAAGPGELRPENQAQYLVARSALAAVKHV